MENHADHLVETKIAKLSLKILFHLLFLEKIFKQNFSIT